MKTSSIARLQNKKRIVMLTYGSRGDVEPFVALGLRLIYEGFLVRLIAPKPFKPLVESTGIEFVPIDSDPDELGQLFANQAGTSGTSVTSGVPNSAIPFSLDQSFWAKRLSQLCVGPTAPQTKQLTIHALEQMILDATENGKFSNQAKLIAEKIKREDGISTTIAIINNLVSGS